MGCKHEACTSYKHCAFLSLVVFACLTCTPETDYEPEGREFESLRAHHSFDNSVGSAATKPFSHRASASGALLSSVPWTEPVDPGQRVGPVLVGLLVAFHASGREQPELLFRGGVDAGTVHSIPEGERSQPEDSQSFHEALRDDP